MSEKEPPSAEPFWYCVRAKPKAEHLAAAHLDRIDGASVFCPRIRYEKATRRGPVWFFEALFPRYVFAKFDFENQLRHINGTPNVSGVLHFGDIYPTIEESYLTELRAEFPAEEKEIRVIEPQIEVGDTIEVVQGPMKGLQTVVTQVLPSQERVNTLLEWLGEEREAEVSLKIVRKPGDVRHY